MTAAHDPAAGAGLSAEEREALLRAWPWPKEAATTEHGFADVVTAVERILAAERERIANGVETAWRSHRDRGHREAAAALFPLPDLIRGGDQR